MKKKILVKYGQTIYDIAIQELGSVEGIFAIQDQNPVDITEIGVPLSEGLKLIVAAEPTDAKVLQFFTEKQICPVSGGEDEEPITKTITLGTPVIDCGSSLSIPISQTGLSEAGTLKGFVSFDEGTTFADADIELPIIPLFEIPISNYGDGVPNGTYTLKLVSNEDPTVESNAVTFIVDCPYGQYIRLDNVQLLNESNATGDPVDIIINMVLFDGYDGTDDIKWQGTEIFKLQYQDAGGSWIDIGTFTDSDPTIDDAQLPNGIYTMRVVCVDNNIVNLRDMEVEANFNHAPAEISFSCNLWGTTNDDTGNVDGYEFTIIIDAIDYTVTGNASMNPSQMHEAMRDLILAGTQGITYQYFSLNGSDINYAHVIKAPANSNATWNGVVVQMIVKEGGNPRFANATVAGNYENIGTGEASGTFTGGY